MTRGAWLNLVLFASAAVGPSWAQAPPVGTESTVVVTPGAEYRAGAIHRWLLGRHYRELWTTPVRVPVLELESFGAGLQPIRRGGGQQTRSLRFQGRDGREYVFRSVNKDLSPVLPPELRATLVDRLVQDQASAGHPAAPLVVGPLLDAAGVLHAEARLVLMPDDARLGQFRSEFAGMLGTIEERPEGADDAVAFQGAARVIGTDKLLDRLERSLADRVDARAFLAARLVDLFLGDWDRHRDQWRWATRGTTRPSVSVPTVWLPIPRDRDQALVKMDGFLLGIARTYYPQLTSFGKDYPSMLGLTWNGRELDRRLLVGLERPVWDSIATALQGRLTDSVIAEAAGRLPPEYRPVDSMRLRTALIHRRDRLPEAAGRFYRLLAGEVDVHATDLAESVAVERLDDGVTLTIAVADSAVADSAVADSGGAPAPYYRRRFDRGETHDLRIYLQGGDDRVRVAGRGEGGIKIRIIGGGGDDLVVDSSRAGGTTLYDSRGDNRVVGGARLDRRSYTPPGDTLKPGLPPRDWGRDWRSLTWVGLAPDVGLLVGGGVVRYGYGFRKHPYASRIALRAAVATGGGIGRAELSGVFHRTNSRARVRFKARASGVEVLRFHGFGNETELAGPSEFYDVRQQQYSFTPELVLPLDRAGKLTVAAGPTIQYAHTDLEPGRFISALRPYGTPSFGQVGAQASGSLDTRDRQVAATRGFRLLAAGSYYPGVWDVTRAFGEVHGEAATYLTVSRVTLALRSGAKRVFGRFPFHESAFLGGASTVRLGRQQRYAGDAVLYGNTELRVHLARVFLVLPADLGVFGLGDVGRVFLEGERSDRWHGAFGGGVSLAFLQPVNTVSLAVARGEERTGVYLQGGFAF